MVSFLTPKRRLGRRKQRVACVAFPAGARLFDCQHPSRRIYWLRSGCVQLSRDHKVVVDYLKRGALLGEKLLLSLRGPDQVAKAISAVEVSVFRKAEFFRRLRQDGRFAQQVLKSLALRMDRYEEAIRELATEPAERRLALALGRLAPTRPATGWVRLPWNPTNPEFAKMIGTTRWRISHFLNRFQRLGWVRRQAGLWVQREGLQAFLKLTVAPPQDTAQNKPQ